VVGKHAVLLQNFDADLKPQDMKFNKLAVWVRILNLPFGYMQEKWGKLIAGMIGCEGSVPKVDCDNLGRCWGSFMRARIEVETNKPLMRGVTIYSQRRKVSEWFQVQYEQLPHYCFSCGILGHSSIECKNPGERDEEGRLPYSADRLCAPDERKKKAVNSKSSNGSAPANPRHSSARSPDQANSVNRSGGSGSASTNPGRSSARSPDQAIPSNRCGGIGSVPANTGQSPACSPDRAIPEDNSGGIQSESSRHKETAAVSPLANPIMQADQCSGKEIFSSDDNWKIFGGKET
jgi:hypothetical protein